MKRISIFVAFLALSVSVFSQTEILVNPDFNPAGAGWTASGNVGFGTVSAVNCFKTTATFSGGETPVTGIISQNFSPAVGDTLELTILHGGTASCSPAARAEVEIIDLNTNTQLYQAFFQDAGVCVNPYQTLNHTLVAASNNLQIRITDRTPSTFSCDMNLDLVSVLRTPGPPNNSVPTLSQWGLIILALSLLCLGAVALISSRRNTRKQVTI